eukprot:SM000014S00353  [mRNA]  locus=s14:953906:955293:+ [translate_table: standard]
MAARLVAQVVAFSATLVFYGDHGAVLIHVPVLLATTFAASLFASRLQVTEPPPPPRMLRRGGGCGPVLMAGRRPASSQVQAGSVAVVGERRLQADADEFLQSGSKAATVAGRVALPHKAVAETHECGNNNRGRAYGYSGVYRARDSPDEEDAGSLAAGGASSFGRGNVHAATAEARLLPPTCFLSGAARLLLAAPSLRHLPYRGQLPVAAAMAGKGAAPQPPLLAPPAALNGPSREVALSEEALRSIETAAEAVCAAEAALAARAAAAKAAQQAARAAAAELEMAWVRAQSAKISVEAATTALVGGGSPADSAGAASALSSPLAEIDSQIAAELATIVRVSAALEEECALVFFSRARALMRRIAASDCLAAFIARTNCC